MLRDAGVTAFGSNPYSKAKKRRSKFVAVGPEDDPNYDPNAPSPTQQPTKTPRGFNPDKLGPQPVSNLPGGVAGPVKTPPAKERTPVPALEKDPAREPELDPNERRRRALSQLIATTPRGVLNPFMGRRRRLLGR